MSSVHTIKHYLNREPVVLLHAELASQVIYNSPNKFDLILCSLQYQILIKLDGQAHRRQTCSGTKPPAITSHFDTKLF